jgi:Tol biopolymer transport system component
LIEIGSWAQKAIALGANPSWSPKGDWIAYLADWNETCMLIHPDGTGAKMVLDLRSRTSGWLLFKSGWVFRNGEVWSPDEEKLLLIEGQMDGPKYDVSMLDLASGKVTTKSKNGALVLGWVAEKP